MTSLSVPSGLLPRLLGLLDGAADDLRSTRSGAPPQPGPAAAGEAAAALAALGATLEDSLDLVAADLAATAAGVRAAVDGVEDVDLAWGARLAGGPLDVAAPAGVQEAWLRLARGGEP